MPFDSNKWNDERFVPYSEMLQLIESQRPEDLRKSAPLERCNPDEEKQSSDTTKWHRAKGHLGRVSSNEEINLLWYILF